PDLISVQFRDLGALPVAPRHEVRRLQREYAEMWVEVLMRLRPELGPVDARAHVHAVFGLLNSSPRLPAMAEADLRRLLTAMAAAALRACGAGVPGGGPSGLGGLRRPRTRGSG